MIFSSVTSTSSSSWAGKNSCNGRIDQADDHRQAVHGPEQAFKVGALEGQQLVQRFLALLGGFCLVCERLGQDHLLDDRQAFGLEEHVLGAAEANALGAEAARPLGVARVVGVRPDLETAEAVSPGQELAQIGVAQVRHHRRDLPGEDLTGRAVDRDPVAFLVDLSADGHLLGLHIDVKGCHSDDSRLAELASHEGSVGGPAALAGQDAVGRQHAMDVRRARLRADHDHLLLLLFGPLLRQVGGKGDLADGRAGRHVQAGGNLLGLLPGLGIKLRVQVEVDLLRLDPADRFFLGDQSFFNHIDGDADLGLRRALAVAGLQHPQLAVLDGELDVLHVAVVLLKLLGDVGELSIGLRHLLLELSDLLGVADARNHILTLSVGQVVALDLRIAGIAAAGHRHAGGGVVAHVAEDHGDDVDRRPEVVRDLGRVAIVDGALSVPGAKDRLGGQPELLERIVREVASGLVADDLLEGRHEVLEDRGRDLGVLGDPCLCLGLLERLVERLGIKTHHDRAKHLNQAAIGIVDEACVTRELDHSFGRLFVQADVQNGVHHTRHRELRARAAGDQERVFRIAELLACLLLHLMERIHHLIPHPFRELAAAGEVGIAGLGGDGEAGWNRNPDPGHFRQVGAFAPQQCPDPVPRLGLLLRLVDFIE